MTKKTPKTGSFRGFDQYSRHDLDTFEWLRTDSLLNPFGDDPVAKAAYLERSAWEDNQSPRTSSLFQNEYKIETTSDTRELLIGMRMNDVVSLWGRPRKVEVAGESFSGNEKWTYLENLTNRWISRPKRVVYFENGRVAGWENASRD